MAKLTQAAIDRLKAGPKRREVPDSTAGLRLVIQPTGGKSWAVRFRRPDGKTAKVHLGPLDTSGREVEGDPVIGQPLTLVQARLLAAGIARQRARGVDVWEDRKRQRDQGNIDAGITFGTVAPQFIARYRKDRKSWLTVAKYLGLDKSLAVVPGGLADRLKSKPIRSITEEDVHHWVHVQAVRKGGENHGRHLADALKAMMRWCREQRIVSTNPCAGMTTLKPPQSRDRVLNFRADVRRADELRWLWKACGEAGVFGQMVRVLVLVGARRNEIAWMEAGELNDDRSILRLPGKRVKNGLDHEVFLTPTCRALLPADPGKFVFSTNGGSRPISGFSKFKTDLDARMLRIAKEETGDDALVIPPWTLHDCRRLFSTACHELDLADPHIVELCLGHRRKTVAAVYNRSRSARQQAECWTAWTDKVLEIVGQ